MYVENFLLITISLDKNRKNTLRNNRMEKFSMNGIEVYPFVSEEQLINHADNHKSRRQPQRHFSSRQCRESRQSL